MGLWFGIFGEHGVEPLDAAAPELFEVAKKILGSADGLGIPSDDALPPPRRASHEVSRLEHRDMLLHGRERHVIALGELGDRGLLAERAAHDVASRRIGKCPEDPVHLLVTEFINLCNHLVVRYAWIPSLSIPGSGYGKVEG